MAVDLEQYPHAMDIDRATGKPMSKVSNNSTKAAVVTPDDVVVLEATKGLYVGVSGDVAVTMTNGGDVVLKALSSGVIHPISVVKIKASGTTATSILAMY